MDNKFYISPGGSDLLGSGTAASPWATVGYAVRYLSPGDEIICRGGDYASTAVTIGKSGILSAPCLIRAFAGETPIFSGLVLTLAADYWKLIGLSFDECDLDAQGEGVTYLDCTFTDTERSGSYATIACVVDGESVSDPVDHSGRPLGTMREGVRAASLRSSKKWV